MRLPGMLLRVERRALAVTSALVVVMLAAGTVALLVGDYSMSAIDALRALVGQGDDPLAVYFVQEQRAPRVLAAVLVGIALGCSGAIMQALSDNPLGSPDVIGFTTGAATGAILAIVVAGASPGATAAGAVVGGLVTAAVVYALAYRGGVSGGRLVLVGLGLGMVLQAVNSLLIVRADLPVAQDAAQWLAGSFNATTWPSLVPVAVAVAIGLPCGLVLGRSVPVMRLGDDLAHGLGLAVESRRGALVLVSVVLVAVATATAGPIAFVALAAPQLALRLTRGSTLGLPAAGMMGACLVLVSDVLAQRLFAPTQLAVGVVSGCLGGLYLIWLLTYQWRRR